MALLIRFRSANLRRLCERAVSQGFGQRVTGSGHLGIVCPTCGHVTIFSGTQRDVTPFKFENQLSRLRNHGLEWEGKKTKGCQGVHRNTA
jgi:hypothetical protein